MSSSSSDASSNDALSADIDADNEDAVLQEDGSCADIDHLRPRNPIHVVNTNTKIQKCFILLVY